MLDSLSLLATKSKPVCFLGSTPSKCLNTDNSKENFKPQWAIPRHSNYWIFCTQRRLNLHIICSPTHSNRASPHYHAVCKNLHKMWRRRKLKTPNAVVGRESEKVYTWLRVKHTVRLAATEVGEGERLAALVHCAENLKIGRKNLRATIE